MSEADDVRAWVTKAEEDWLGVGNELRAERVPWSVVCFHCPQVAEKYLKAFLVARNQPAERTHDLAKLMDVCRDLEPDLVSLRSDCLALAD